MKVNGRGALLAIALAALTGGCGSAASSSETVSESAAGVGGFPVTVEDGFGPVAVERRPERIVSLSPSATETLFAVGAGDQVVAVDDQSDHPAGVPTTDLSAYQPNVEAIAAYRPDLVIVPTTVPRDVIGALRRLGLTVYAEPAPRDLSEAYDEMREMGDLTGHAEAGRRLARQVRSDVERLVARSPDTDGLKVFHELDPDMYTAASHSFIGRIYQRLGLDNVADPAARATGSAYPQMSSEAVVSADPDVVVLADAECCGQTPEKVRRRPGWKDVSAVRRGAVVPVDEDVSSRWGPRIPEFVEAVIDALRQARGSAAGDG